MSLYQLQKLLPKDAVPVPGEENAYIIKEKN